MASVTVFVGSFDGGEQIGDFEFPSVPQVGDEISYVKPERKKVLAVNHHISHDYKVMTRILVEPFDEYL